MGSDQGFGLVHYLAKITIDVGERALSVEERRAVRQHLLDALASAFIGRRGRTFEDLLYLCPRVERGCGWPGGGPERVHPLDAGMIWAFAVNGSVFEDGSREGACHPGAAVIPAIVPLSEGKDWDQIERSAIAGYDVMVRVARSGNPRFTMRGFHPTAITAPFGAAAAASVLLGHDLCKTKSALSLAAMGSAGLMASFRSGPTQPVQVAWAVRNGIAAAFLAGAGQSGYPRIMEEGFYPAYLGQDPDPPVDSPLDHGCAIVGSYLKPYPGCRHLHPSIDAFDKILNEEGVPPNEIQGIRVGTYKTAVDTEIHQLKSRGDAYFNIPFALAARAVLGKNDYDAFDERHFNDTHLLELMKKVEVFVDPEVDGKYPGERGSFVEVETVGGRTFCHRVSHPLGEPENPLDESVTLEKFRSAAKPFLAGETLERVEGILHPSGRSEPAHDLFDALCENNQSG